MKEQNERKKLQTKWSHQLIFFSFSLFQWCCYGRLSIHDFSFSLFFFFSTVFGSRRFIIEMLKISNSWMGKKGDSILTLRLKANVFLSVTNASATQNWWELEELICTSFFYSLVVCATKFMAMRSGWNAQASLSFSSTEIWFMASWPSIIRIQYTPDMVWTFGIRHTHIWTPPSFTFNGRRYSTIIQAAIRHVFKFIGVTLMQETSTIP